MPHFSGDITVAPALNLAGGLTPTIVLAADLDVHVNLIDFSGNLAPQITLGGSRSLLVPTGQPDRLALWLHGRLRGRRG